jgi:hypothetical protein
MVAFSDVVPSGIPHDLRQSKDRQVRKTSSAGRAGLSVLMRFVGIVLMMAAAGIWLLSVPRLDAEMMLIRLAASVLFLCTGLMLLQARRSPVRDEIQLDPRSGELRHVQRGRDGIARTRHSFKIAELGAITIVDDQVTLRSVTGDVVMHLSGLPRAQLHLMERKLRNL